MSGKKVSAGAGFPYWRPGYRFAVTLVLVATVSAQSVFAQTREQVSQSGVHGNYAPHRNLAPETQIQIALQHNTEGRKAEAFKALSEAIAFKPDVSLYAVRANLHLEHGDPASALQDLNEALALDPEDVKLLNNRAQLLLQFNDVAAAAKDLNLAIEANPDFVASWYNRGSLRFEQNQFEEALSDFSHCIELDSALTAPYFNRASTYYALGKTELALADIDYFIDNSTNAEWVDFAVEVRQKWVE